jgi:uncharacterized protein
VSAPKSTEMPASSDEIIAATEALVRERMSGEPSGHDWHHTDRVRRVALRIATEEEAAGREVDRTVVELAALLHDLDDWKFSGDETAGSNAAIAWLTSHGLEREPIDRIAEIVATISFKGAGVATPMRTLEGAIVQDADRLDAIGAIGIARAFAYGGFKGQALHDPALPPRMHATFEEYRTGSGTTINHFSEKLLLLRARMNTEPGRRLANDRHRVMEQFLARFHAEWNGEA